MLAMSRAPGHQRTQLRRCSFALSASGRVATIGQFQTFADCMSSAPQSGHWLAGTFGFLDSPVTASRLLTESNRIASTKPGEVLSRTYGLSHHRRKILRKRVQLMLHVVIPIAQPKVRRPVLCWRCGQPMRIRLIPRTFRIDAHTDSPARATRSAKV